MANELILIVEDMPQDRTRIMAAGFNGFRGKPISVRELLATVREILDKP
jgi:DNA-binding response OmpR family regulator